jgi:hypothetical protein
MEPAGNVGWMRVGAAAALALALALSVLRRRRLARIALGFAAACLGHLRDARLSTRVHALLAKAGRDV